MGRLSRFFGLETRTSVGETVRASDPYLAEVFGLGGPVNATPDNVLSNLAVAARCVALRSELMASVGLALYRRDDNGGRSRADDNALYGVLHDIANPNMSAFEAREFLIRSLDLTGNAFARIETSGRGQVVALYPIAPGRVAVEQLASGRLRYRVSDTGGGVTILLQEEMLHIRGPSRDGLVGVSPIAMSRGALSFALAQHQTAQSLTDNALRPSGILSFPERLNMEQRNSIKAQMRDQYAGASNSGKLLVMDGGATFEKLAFSPDDAEFLDSRKLANEDVARIFGMPPTTVGITEKATYSNTEQEARALVQNAIGPLAKRVETAMMRCLLTDVGRRSLYIEHDLDVLLGGDVQARFEAYRIGREIGALSPNDIRRAENDPPIPNGDVYHQPANWVPLGSKVEEKETPVTAHPWWRTDRAAPPCPCHASRCGSRYPGREVRWPEYRPRRGAR